MNKRASIANNTISLLAAKVIGCLATIVLVAIIARTIDTEGFGIILAVVIDFGFSILIPREVARRNSSFEQYFVTGCVIKVAFSIGVFVVLLIALPFFYPPPVRYAIYASFAMLALRGFVDFCAAFFNAFERMQYSAMLFLMCNFGIFVVSLIAIFLGAISAWVILLAQACVMLALVAVSFLLTFKVLQPKRLSFMLQTSLFKLHTSEAIAKAASYFRSDSEGCFILPKR